MRKQLIFGVIVSAVCLYLVFRGLSVREVASAMEKAQIKWILAGLTIYAFGFVARAVRWEGLMHPIKPIPAIQLVRPMIIGFFANNVLPFRMGELIRAHVTGEKFDISRTASLGTILLERIFDTIAFLSIFLAVALFLPFPANVKHAATVMGIGCAGLIFILISASHHQARTQAFIARLPLSEKWKVKVIDLIINFTHGVSGMKQGKYVIKALLLSFVVWSIEGTTVYCIANAFPVHLTYAQAYFLVFFLGLAVTLPQAPGYVGTVELFGVTALSLLHIPRDQGLPVILAIHGCQFTFIVVLGAYMLWKERMSFGRLLEEGKEDAG